MLTPIFGNIRCARILAPSVPAGIFFSDPIPKPLPLDTPFYSFRSAPPENHSDKEESVALTDQPLLIPYDLGWSIPGIHSVGMSSPPWKWETCFHLCRTAVLSNVSRYSSHQVPGAVYRLPACCSRIS